MRNAIARISIALAVAFSGLTIAWVSGAAGQRTGEASCGVDGPVRRSQRVRLADGTALRYVEQGEAAGEVIILLHGFTDSWFSFSRVLPLIPETYRVIVPDQRGHGCSDRPASGYAMRDLAGDILSMMDALAIERATVVGHSMGSFVAQQIAAARPERVDRLVLVGSATALSRVPGMVEFGQAIDALTDPVDPDFIRDFQLSTVHRELPAAFMDAVVAESEKLPARVWQALVHGMLEMEPVDLHRARMPALVLWGESDALFPRAEQDAVRAALHGATLKTYADTGHAPHWERPDVFAADLIRFLGQTRSRAGA